MSRFNVRKRVSLFAPRTTGQAQPQQSRPAHQFRRAVLLDRGHRIEDGDIADLPRFLHLAKSSADTIAVAWYDRPTRAQIHELAEILDLHPVLVEDIEIGNQRPKIERYGDTLFVVLRTAKYLDEPEEVAYGEIHILVTKSSVVIVRQASEEDQPWHPSDLRHLQELVALGTEGVLYSIIDQVVDGYIPVLAGVNNDIEEIERQVFGGDSAAPERTYRLSREVIDVQHATQPIGDIVAALQSGFAKYRVDDELQTYLTDVQDHLDRVATKTQDAREVLAQILTVNATLVGQRQNEDMKKISSWAAILFAPTLIGAIYGMNFDDMPELHWAFGYPMALGGMLGMAIVLYAVFKRNRWL